MIRLEAVGVRVGRFALEDISLEIPSGGYGLVIGPTGSGKTTLLETIAGHNRVHHGRILLRGTEVSRAAPESRHVGFVYQHYHLFPHLSVEENIGYGIEDAGARRARVRELGELLHLSPLLARGTGGLSGGEQQRVALARALAPRPSILLLDEPFAAVDPTTRRGLRRELRALHEREGVTTLQVTHDFEDAMRLGDVVAVLAGGRVVQSGSPESVFRFPNSAFVAEFIGTGTVLKGVVERTSEPDPTTGRFAARFRGQRLELEVVAEREGPAYAVLRPTDLLLSRDAAAGPAPRNRFAGIVTRVEREMAVAQVHLDVQGTELLATVMTSTADELGLVPGSSIGVAVKATAVHLI
jgi:molybdate/tungstate transport system ATP-binding protein